MHGAKFDEAIYVLHAFEKKTQRTPQHDIELARACTPLYLPLRFRDNWEHMVRIEDLVMPPKEAARVRCLAGENACPPEDVGGPNAYFDFLTAIRDPAHEEHASMLEWAGGKHAVLVDYQDDH